MRKLPRRQTWVVGVVVVALGAAAPAGATIINLSASLDGVQSIPACGASGVGVASAATGAGTFVMDTCANTLSIDVSFSGLETPPESVSHIHGPAAVGVNAGVLFGLPLGSPKLTVWNFDESEEADILAGLTYVNVHGQAPCGGGEIRGQIVQETAQPTPGPCPTTTPTPTATPTATRTPDTDHYVLYKAKAAKAPSAPLANKFPKKDYNLRLNDLSIADAAADDPENYQVKKEKGLAVPAMKNDEPGPADPALHYVRYQIKEAKQGSGAYDDGKGKYPKAVKAVPRVWALTNQFGTINVATKKVDGLLVPASKDPDTPAPPAPADATHYLCYQAKPTKTASDQTPGGRLRKDLQAYFGDQFLDLDCATDRNGAVAFPGSAVTGTCLFDLKKVKLLCNPVAKDDVGGTPPRVTVAPGGSTSTPSSVDSLLCYQAKLASKVSSAGAATLGGVTVGDKLKQSKPAKRAPYTTPGNQFPVPTQMETKKVEMVCIPTFVSSD